ncbi:MAG: FG-GAP-like repeat-containing protein [Planctomycetota bacterium]
MSALLAIVADTWRQSRQQVVFVLLLLALALLVAAAVFLPGRERPVLTRWHGRGLGLIAPPAEPIALPAGDPVALAAADLDGDGDQDLLVVTGQAPSYPLLNDGKGGFQPGPALDAAADAVWLGDLTGDGKPDLVLLREGAGATLWRDEGGGRFAGLGAPLGTSPLDLCLADLDRDGDLDLVLAEREGPAATYLNDGKGAFAPGPSLGAGRRVATGDFDGDGALDVALLLPEGVAVWRRVGAAYRPERVLAGEQLGSLVVADFDRDGHADLFVTGERPALWLCRRPGSWEQATSYLDHQREVLGAFAADANGDGQLDLVLVSSGGRGEVHLNVTRAGYTEPVFRQAQQLPKGVTRALALLDADGDGKLDAVGVAGVHGLDLPGVERDTQGEAWKYWLAKHIVIFGGEEDLSARELRASEETLRRFSATPALQRDAELLALVFGKAVFTLSMVLFIAACAGYFPGMLQDGAIDVVLARPLSRLQVFLGKYLGGLALYTAAVLGASGLLALGLGLRFGVWLPSVFLFVPIQVLSAATLYAVLACVGIFVRSSALPLLLGLFLFLGVDSALEIAITLQRAGAITNDWAGAVLDAARVALPNFGLLKDAATDTVYGLVNLPAQPLLTATVWLLLFLGLGYLRFRTADY